MATRKAFAVRDIAAEQGERAHGFISIGETAGGAIALPIVLLNGADDGPVLCVTAGVHATEYPPIDAVMRIVHALDPRRMKGTLIAVPVTNLAMFERRTPFVSPLDGLNLNKIAPGNIAGSISERLARILLDEIIGRAQYYIDVHGGDVGEELMPFAACSRTGRADIDHEAETLARLYTPELLSVSSDGVAVPPFQGSIAFEAAQRGIVAVFGEAGGDGTLREEDVQIHVAGILNVMRYLGMVEGEPAISARRTMGTSRFAMRAERSGLVRVKVRTGDAVTAGQELADIRNVFGETVQVIRAPRSGVAGLIWSQKVVSSGEQVVRCWVTEPAPPFDTTKRFVRARATEIATLSAPSATTSS